jgi:O-antigen biosynthesis protein
MEENLLYHTQKSEFIKNPDIIKIIDWIPSSSRVLEFGCHSGLLSEVLQLDKQCTVTGIEINSVALELAKKWQEISIHIDINDITTWKNKLIGQKYDVICFMHVLEHLQDPFAVLKNAIELLDEKGCIIIGLPNVSNAKDRFDMFLGNFEYTEMGIMDKTHCSMFNYNRATTMIKQSGLTIEEYHTSWQVNPIKEFINHSPLWRFSRFIGYDTPRFLKNRPNLTDCVMVFKCSRLKKSTES